MSFLEFQQKNTLFGKTNYGIFHYSLRVIDGPKMSEIRILNLCHKKSILVDIYRQWLLNSFVSWKNRRRCLADTLNDTWPVLFHISYREIPLRPYSYIFTADLTFASSECCQSSFYLFLILPFQGRHWPSLPSDVLWGSFVTHSFLPVRGGEMNAWPTNPKGRLRGGYHWPRRTWGAYHLKENFGNSGWKVNGKVTLRKFQPKIEEYVLR